MSRAGRQAPRPGTVPGGSPAPCAKRGRPPAAEERWKYLGWAEGEVACAKQLEPKLFARGLCFGARVRCCHVSEVKSGLVAWPVALFSVPVVGQSEVLQWDAEAYEETSSPRFLLSVR